jgi:hypothetical protein
MVNMLASNIVDRGFKPWSGQTEDITFYPAMTAFTDQYSLPNIFFDIGQL